MTVAPVLQAATEVEEARRIARSAAPVRERLRALIALAARVRSVPSGAARTAAELAVWEAAQPLLEEEERPVRSAAELERPLPEDDLAREVLAAAARRARRRALVPRAAAVPVEGPRWAEAILDAGDEVLGVHRETGAVYPIELWRVLDDEASGAIVAARLAGRGFTREQVAEVLHALEVPAPARRRILEALRGGERRCR